LLRCINFVSSTVNSLPSRRHVLGALSAIPLAALAPGRRARAGVPGARVRVAVGGRAPSHAFRHLPLSVAARLDYFRAEGLDITWLEYADDAQALQAVQEGVADVGAMGFEQTLLAHDGRVAVRSLVLQARAPQLVLAVSVQALPRYRSLADLRRREIGVSSVGGMAQAMACMALAQAGVNVDDVHFVAVGDGAQAMGALRSGQVQALCHADPVMSRLERRGEVRVVSDTRSLAGAQGLFGGTMPGSCLVAPVPFLQKRPEEAQALAHGVVHALKWLQTAAPADMVRIAPPDDFMGDRSLYLAALARVREAISPDGLMPEGGPETSLRALGALDPSLSARRPDLARTFTQDFARKAKQKFSA
jgi:NitT/TauT family transport system substrate-binding protein